eukprot:403355948
MAAEIINKKGGYWDFQDELIFDSNFESGNLDFVGKVSENEFDLLMRLDTNSRSHQCWYYFSIECRYETSSMVQIEMCNRWIWMAQGWLKYSLQIYKTYFSFSFEYTFEFDLDKVWFAYAIPYSYTMQQNFIKSIEEIQQKPENKTGNLIFKKEVLGRSLSGVDIPLLTITDFSENNKRKKTVLLCGRLHPGETHSSWLIHGLIRYLLSENYKAQELRKRVVFKIVPMLNPDGVIIGNYRTSLAGCDINRNFGDREASQRLNPEAVSFKKHANLQQRLAFFFDIHSHSSKKSVFIYGPYFPLHSEHYLKLRILPKLIQEKTQMFRYYSCRFRNEPHKVNSVRQTFCRNLNLPQSYTIETSIMGFLNKERQTISFGISSLQYFGEKLGDTILDWFLIMEQHQREKIKKAILMSKQRKTRKRTIIDILGEEDYQEFREEIDDQLDQEENKIKKVRAKTQSGGKRNKLRRKTYNNLQIKSQQSQEIQENNEMPERTYTKNSIQDNDSDDEMTTSHQFALKPTIFQLQTYKEEAEEKTKKLTNRGFFVPRLAGFEYLEGPEKQRQEVINKNDANYLDQQLLEDSMYMFEDQANHQEGDQPLKRLEDIVGEIKRDLLKKSNINVNEYHNNNNTTNQQHHGNDINEQLCNESDLDSMKGDSSDDEENPKEQDEIDEDCLKIQNCLEAYLENIDETSKKKTKSQFNFNDKMTSKLPLKVNNNPQSNEKKKENLKQNLPQQIDSQPTPKKIRKIIITQNEQKNASSPRKEVVYQVKNQQIINNMKPQIRIKDPNSENSKRHYKRNTQGVHYQHQTAASHDIDQDLSFTLTHKSNNEFFDLLKRYIHSGPQHNQEIKVVPPPQPVVQYIQPQTQMALINLGSRNDLVNQISRQRDEQNNKTLVQKMQKPLSQVKQRALISKSNVRGSSIYSNQKRNIITPGNIQHQLQNEQLKTQNNFMIYVEGQNQQQQLRLSTANPGMRASLGINTNFNMRLRSQKPSLKDILSNDFNQSIMLSQKNIPKYDDKSQMENSNLKNQHRKFHVGQFKLKF